MFANLEPMTTYPELELGLGLKFLEPLRNLLKGQQPEISISLLVSNRGSSGPQRRKSLYDVEERQGTKWWQKTKAVKAEFSSNHRLLWLLGVCRDSTAHAWLHYNLQLGLHRL